MRTRTALAASILLVVLVASTPAAAGENVWTFTGFLGGDVMAVAVHPDDPDYLLAGVSSHGIYYSLDGGTTWTEGGLDRSIGGYVSDIEMSSSAAGTAYATDCASAHRMALPR